jgi:hypothetical protein
MSQFEGCVAAKYAYAIIDLVSRKWIATILASEATGVQVRVLFSKALQVAPNVHQGCLPDSGPSSALPLPGGWDAPNQSDHQCPRSAPT